MDRLTQTGLVIASILFLVALPAAAQNFVVISSTVSGIAVGQIVGATQELRIPAKKKIILVNEKGKTESLAGPFKGKVGGTAGGERSRGLTVLVNLVRATQRDTKSVGAIRAAGIRTEDQALMINLSETGEYCLLDGRPPTLTRYQSEKAGSVELTAVRGGKVIVLRWSNENRILKWPTSLELKDGDVFLARQGTSKSRTMIRVHRMDKKITNRIKLIIAAMEKECVEQARMLLALIRNSAS